MKRLISVLFVLISMLFIINCQNQHVSNQTLDSNTFCYQHKKVIFCHKLDEALNYLDSVCGKDGTKKTVILVCGNIVYSGIESEIPQPVWSCTKSFTGTMLGILIAKGKCSLDSKVCDFLPELKNHYPGITFRHLATMTSGYRALGDEPRGDYAHGPSLTPFLPSPDPLFSPGSKFRYWDSAMNLFAYALTKVAGEPIKNFFQREIAGPIRMDAGKWDWKDFGEVDGLIVNVGAGNSNKGISISAKEFAKFGQLMLQNGEWEGKQILPKGWVAEATSPQVKNIIKGNNTPYGYNWWTSGIFPSAPDKTFAAIGFNNNMCIIIPKWDMVVVRLGLDGNIDDAKWNNFFEILSEAFDK